MEAFSFGPQCEVNTKNAVTGWSFRVYGGGTAWTVVCVNFFALLPLRSTRASRPPRYRLCSPKILKNLRLFWVAHNQSPVIPLWKKIICLVPEIFCLKKNWIWLTDMSVTSGLYKNYIGHVHGTEQSYSISFRITELPKTECLPVVCIAFFFRTLTIQQPWSMKNLCWFIALTWKYPNNNCFSLGITKRLVVMVLLIDFNFWRLLLSIKKPFFL